MQQIGDREAAVTRELTYLREHFHKFRARHCSVHKQIVGCEPSQCAQHTLPTCPQPVAGFLIRCGSYFYRVELVADILDLLHLFLHRLRKPFNLHKQHRARIRRIARVHRRLHCLNTQVVHHFDCGRHDAGGDDAGHGRAGLIELPEYG